MRTEDFSVVVLLSNNVICRMFILDGYVNVSSTRDGWTKEYDHKLAFKYISELRNESFDIRSIVRKLNEIFGIEIDTKNDKCKFRYDSDDVICRLHISQGIRRYELIHND